MNWQPISRNSDADPNWFGICLVTADGAVYEAGDTAQEFTIQSISKPFNYGIALEDHGKAEVLKKIWMEPSGEAFNSISLQAGTGRPCNPMINAGAIATTGLVHGKTTEQKIDRILDVFSRYAGRKLGIDESIYRCESETGHRNRAIGHMLRNFDILTEDPTLALEAYFKQCSVLVTCRDQSGDGGDSRQRRHESVHPSARRGQGLCGVHAERNVQLRHV